MTSSRHPKKYSRRKDEEDVRRNTVKCIVPHLVMLCCMLVKLLVRHLLPGTSFNPVEQWELVWCVSGVGAAVGIIAVDQLPHLTVYVASNVTCGITALLFGVYGLVWQIREDFHDVGKVPKGWKDSVTKVAVACACLLWQVNGLYYGVRLLLFKWNGPKKNKKH